jgi:hypothetical protein
LSNHLRQLLVGRSAHEGDQIKQAASAGAWLSSNRLAWQQYSLVPELGKN